MRVIFYHWGFNHGGAEIVIEHMVESLGAFSKCYIVTKKMGRALRSKTGVELVEVPAVPMEPKIISNFIHGLKCAGRLPNEFNLLMMHNVDVGTEVVLASLAKAKHATVLWWAHDLNRLRLVETGGFPKRIFYLITQTYLSLLDAIIVYSDYMKQAFQERTSKPIHCVKFGVDLQRFTFTEAEPSGKIILFPAKIHPIKGIFELLQAFRIVSDRLPEARLVIAGPDYGAVAEMVRFIDRYGLSEQVTYMGEASYSSMNELYRRAAIVAYPCKGEPWGLTPIEAMACGRPVVVGTGGVRESVVHGETGMHVNPYDPAQISDAIMELLSNHEMLKRMGVQAREHVEKNFDVRDSLSKINDLIRSYT